MELWIIGGVVGLYILRQMWKAHTHPAQVLCRQAANMDWVYSGTENEDGYKNSRLQRGQYEAVVSFTNENVRLTRPNHPTPFKDFVAIEHWINQKNGDPIERLKQEIQDWPQEQAKAALELLIATIEGDEQKIDETYLLLTMGQLETVTSILKSMEE